MFHKIRTHLLLNTLLIFLGVLGTAAIAVRLVFTANLKQQTTAKLVTAGRAIASETELEDGRLEVEDEFLRQTIFGQTLSLEWFDLQKRLVEKTGDFFPTTPLDTQSAIQLETEKSIHTVTLPILDEDTAERIGYIRVSQPTDDVVETLQQLDMGLGAGVIVATVLSSIGIIWLNRQAMQPIEESFHRLKQFTADASHELRSPLMAISSNAEVSLKYPAGMRSEDHEAMMAIVSAAEQMTRLTEDLLLLARADASTDKVSTTTLAPLNLSALLKDLVQLYRPQAVRKQVELAAYIEPDLEMQGDSASLARAFTNLLQNAIRYTPAEGTVEISASRRRDQLQVMVKDTGVGIAKEHLNRIFERFWRDDRVRQCAPDGIDNGGTGLGLPIAQAIVHSHGGSIAIASQLGQGSCFTVTLPAVF